MRAYLASRLGGKALSTRAEGRLSWYAEGVRITGGAFRSRALIAPKGHATRPTSDRVREALFSILHAADDAPYGEGALDLYAGTGALGLEAVSRGAPRAVLVEQSPKALAALRANVAALAPERVTVHAGRVEQVLPRLSGRFGVVFCDPPYADLREDRTWEVLSRVGPLLEPEGTFVLERSPGDPPRDLPGLEIWLDRAYGDTALTLYRLAPRDTPQDAG